MNTLKDAHHLIDPCMVIELTGKTLIALLTMYYKRVSAASRGKYTIVCSADLSAAFDLMQYGSATRVQSRSLFLISFNDLSKIIEEIDCYADDSTMSSVRDETVL